MTKSILLVWSILMTVGFLYAMYNLQVIDEEKNAALTECINAVQTDCAPIIGYAIALEKENARLNSALKATRDPREFD
jgi:hypothetical protein